MVSNGSEWNHPIERFNWPVSIDAGLPLLQFLGRLALVAAEFGDQRDHAGIDAGASADHLSFPCNHAPASRRRRWGNRLCPRPLIQDQVKAGA